MNTTKPQKTKDYTTWILFLILGIITSLSLQRATIKYMDKTIHDIVETQSLIIENQTEIVKYLRNNP